MQELDLKAIGTRIKEQREDLDYTREKFSELLSISVKHLREIEIGAKGMSIEVLAKMSKKLKLTTDYILFGTGVQNDDRLSMAILSCEGKERELLNSFVKDVIKVYNG